VAEFPQGFVDLHSHTNESDGTFTPAELVELALRVGLDALAITDHDTITGYEKAVLIAEQAGLDLLCGIELNTKMGASDTSEGRTAHMLAYFPGGSPSGEFRQWLTVQQTARGTRNRKLAESLQSRGLDITLAEVEARGRSLAGRPHFARILVDKGYARNSQDAFDRFIGEQAPCFVERESISTERAIEIVRHSHGVPVGPSARQGKRSHRSFQRGRATRARDLSFRASARAAGSLPATRGRIRAITDRRLGFPWSN